MQITSDYQNTVKVLEISLLQFSKVLDYIQELFKKLYVKNIFYIGGGGPGAVAPVAHG